MVTEHSDSTTSSSRGIWHRLKVLLGLRRGSLKESVEEVLEEHSSSGGQIDEEEKEMLQNVLAFNELSVEDVMIPRADIIAVEYGIEFQDLKDVILDKVHTRLPVYRGTLDDIVGFIHIKDLVSILCESDAFNIDQILRKALFVPPSMKSSALLLKMQVTRVHIAMVVDEFGGTCGMLTMEDLMEEIVGEIEDEHDDVNEEMIHRRSAHVFEVNARLDIKAFEEALEITIDREQVGEDFDTVGGLLFFLLGRVPAVGEVIPYKNENAVGTALVVEFEIVEADPRRIKRMLVRLKNDEGDGTNLDEHD